MPSPYFPAKQDASSLRPPQARLPPAPPIWPLPTTMSFPKFANLPTEIRHLVWEFYLAASPRIHVVHEAGPAPTSQVPRRDEILSYTVTSLDAATNIECLPNVRTAHINHESLAVFKRLSGPAAGADIGNSPAGGGSSIRSTYLRPFDETLCLARDLERSALGQTLSVRTDAAAAAAAAAATTSPGENGPRRHKGREPVHVDWSRDLLFICSPSNEQAFRNLAEVPWVPKIERLAVLVPRRCESNIPFGPGYVVSHTLRPMTNLKQIYVVMIPFVRPALDPTGPGNSWGRDQYGFVNYVDYLKEVGITTQEMSQERHMTYQRTALSMMQALAKHLEMPGVVLKKVVDVDCKLFTDSGYARKARWLGVMPTTTNSQ